MALSRTQPIVDVECGDCVACCTFVGLPPFDDTKQYIQVSYRPNEPVREPVLDPNREPTEYERVDASIRTDIEIKRTANDWKLGESNDADCIMLDRSNVRQGACTIHGKHPKMCRDFEYASRDCIDARKSRGLVPHDPRLREL